MKLSQCPACGNESVTIDLIQCRATCMACMYNGASLEFVNAASEKPQTADRKDVRIEQLENQLRLKDEVCTSLKNTLNTRTEEVSRELLERDELIHKLRLEGEKFERRISSVVDQKNKVIDDLIHRRAIQERKLAEMNRIFTAQPRVETFRKFPKPSEWVKFPMDKLEPDDKLGWRELHKRQEEKHEFQMLRQKEQSFLHIVIVNLVWAVISSMVFAWSYHK